MTVKEIETILKMFQDFEVHFVVVQRDIERYLSSTWRHAVFRHDYGESYEVFLAQFKNFSFGDTVEKFSPYGPVHKFDMEHPDFSHQIGALLGTKFEIPRANVGVPLGFAMLLQQTHLLLGSKEFSHRFDAQTKERMLDVWNGKKFSRN